MCANAVTGAHESRDAAAGRRGETHRPLLNRVTVWFGMVAGAVAFALSLWAATDWHARLLDRPTFGVPWGVIALFLITSFVPLLPIWRRLSDRLMAGAFVFAGTALGFALGMAYGPPAL